MDAVTATTPPPVATQTAGQTANRAAASAITSDFETFLKMLTTQMQNQDPLNPIDSADFAVQLATFSGVEQQVKTNDLLANLTSRLGANGLADLANWVGMEARAKAPAYFYGEPVAIWPSPDPLADKAVIVVKNGFGNEVGRYEIDVSTDPVSWSGKDDSGNALPDGLYTFQVESFKGDALTRTTQAEVYSLITEARMENGETVLILLGDAKIKSSAVQALRNQPS